MARDPVSSLEAVLARVLFWGGLAGTALAVLGVVAHFVIEGLEVPGREIARLVRREATGRSPHVFMSLPEVVRALGHAPHEPLAVSALGLVLLLATPVVAVAVAVVWFVRAGDRDYAAIAAIVLAMLLASVVLVGGVG